MLRKCLIAALTLLCPTLASAHDPSAKAPGFTPTVGEMSNDVIIQRLRQEGVEGARIVGRSGGDVRVEGLRSGRRVVLDVEALSGRIFDASGATRRLVIGGTAGVPAPAITGPQLQIDRERIADPRLMDGAIR